MSEALTLAEKEAYRLKVIRENENLLMALIERDARIAELEKALRLAKEMILANGLDIPHTLVVINAALQGETP